MEWAFQALQPPCQVRSRQWIGGHQLWVQVAHDPDGSAAVACQWHSCSGNETDSLAEKRQSGMAGLAWLGLNKIFEKKGSPKAVKSWAESYQAFFSVYYNGLVHELLTHWSWWGDPRHWADLSLGLGGWVSDWSSHFYLPSFTLKGISCQNLGPPQ